MNDWQDKVVVVTGGSAGLGCVLVEIFASRGTKVVAVGRSQDKLDAAVRRWDEQGYETLGIAADVTCQEYVDRVFQKTIEQFGRLDVLVNCAGSSARGAVLDTTPEDFQALWEVNFLATVRCTRAAVPHLLESGGHVVNIGSLASKTAARYLAAYPASKFAVAAYSQQLRLELGDQGLHVLLVCPGPIARTDEGDRYEAQSKGLPASAAKPGGGAKVKRLDPEQLATAILTACEKRQPELVMPGKARILFAVSQLSPRLGDWLLKKKT